MQVLSCPVRRVVREVEFVADTEAVRYCGEGHARGKVVITVLMDVASTEILFCPYRIETNGPLTVFEISRGIA
jgi:hypothetical protein